MPTETSKLQTSMHSSKGLRVFQFKFLRLSLSNLQPSFLWAMASGGSFHSESGPLQFFLLFALCICIPPLMTHENMACVGDRPRSESCRAMQPSSGFCWLHDVVGTAEPLITQP